MGKSTDSEKACGTRLVEAAREVFAQDGLKGATTRKIARAAGVNEVTLFRHFESKANLLDAVLKQVADLQKRTLADLQPDREDFRMGLMEYARTYERMLYTDEGLIRTLMGEANRCPELAETITHRCAAPWRESLQQYLRTHQAAGNVRQDVVLPVLVDMFTGFLLAAMLRQTSPWKTEDYTKQEYLAESVRVFTRGIEAANHRKQK